jgi:hypothetical protein
VLDAAAAAHVATYLAFYVAATAVPDACVALPPTAVDTVPVKTVLESFEAFVVNDDVTVHTMFSVGQTLLCIVDWSEAKSQNMHMTTCMIDC